MLRFSFLTIASACLFLPTGCTNSTGRSDADVPASEEGNMTLVEADDPEMMAAEKQARDTLDDFIQAMQKPSPAQSDFGVKHAFVDGETYEHMWISGLTYANGKFSGVLANEPGMVANVKEGDPVTIDRSEVEDWMYFDGENLVGGYTVKVLVSRQ